MTLDTSRII